MFMVDQYFVLPQEVKKKNTTKLAIYPKISLLRPNVKWIILKKFIFNIYFIHSLFVFCIKFSQVL